MAPRLKDSPRRGSKKLWQSIFVARRSRSFPPRSSSPPSCERPCSGTTAGTWASSPGGTPRWPPPGKGERTQTAQKSSYFEKTKNFILQI